MKAKLFFALIVLILSKVSAQDKPEQTLRGSIIDKSIKAHLAGATVELTGGINKQTIANNDGVFKFEFIRSLEYERGYLPKHHSRAQ